MPINPFGAILSAYLYTPLAQFYGFVLVHILLRLDLRQEHLVLTDFDL